MERTRFIEHRGHRILLLDYSGLVETESTLVEIEKSKNMIAQQPPSSVLTLTYVRDANYNGAVLKALKDLAAANKPYVRAGAVVGMSALHRVAYRIIVLFTGRKLQAVQDLDDAKDWLVEQLHTDA